VGSASDTLQQGNAILETVLGPAGFRFEWLAAGQSSGGDFASGKWINGNRSIEIHVRFSLGLVTYWIRGAAMGHAELMQALNVKAQAEYPGYSNDPLDGFRHLRHDLERFGGAFLSGQMTEMDMNRMRSELEKLPKRRLP
jgi:hypothetical protein